MHEPDPAATVAASLDAQVRAADLDRWLSSRLVADDRARADLITLYAFEAELMSIPTRVTQPLLAEMRYTWWAEQLDGVFAGIPRKGHPVLEALTDLVARHALDRAPFDALIEAHIGRVHGEPHDLDAFYVGPMQTAVHVLAGPGHAEKVVEAGRVRGLGQVGRAEEAKAGRKAANVGLKGLPAEGFPAVASAALTTPDEPEPLRRLRLIWATVRGRV
ncbi:MAG: squalene/phytoene synthase family protein [Alphaproteobacteria bacterium]|nr:squalene/phytoene synthase family protein [Alphaproteobacteria bacterium]MBU1519802.1 squalene/phytoene synthase family protein [Alphaproteobacteria bacterium]MBU2031328.1 squalene/phytoene synthase family protein [Alphaproteobacteria bacterium]MBU2163356.1 squalene/phytoene synthase family protein [Alphaproteobacteria bacterium]MBU2230654.1 squalene/phytoene synthase family protein [Alphaproteobacteria bacterium]